MPTFKQWYDETIDNVAEIGPGNDNCPAFWLFWAKQQYIYELKESKILDAYHWRYIKGLSLIAYCNGLNVYTSSAILWFLLPKTALETNLASLFMMAKEQMDYLDHLAKYSENVARDLEKLKLHPNYLSLFN